MVTAVTGRVKEFRLPDLGEGLTEGEILRWLVAVGDTIEVEIERIGILRNPIADEKTA